VRAPALRTWAATPMHAHRPLASIPQAGRLTLAATSMRHAGYTAGGQALIAYLRKGLQQSGIGVWLNAAAESLVSSAGRVSGVVVRRNGIEYHIVARRGVLLAAGGFAHDPARRSDAQPPQPAGGGQPPPPKIPVTHCG
jgi:3-oxosteroid 1-dehydrogenase